MNIEISFVSEIPREDFIWALGYYEDESLDHISPSFQELFRLKAHDLAIETIAKIDGRTCRCVVARLGLRKSKATRHTQELIGAALIKKAEGGVEGVILLDLRYMDTFDSINIVSGMRLSSWRFDRYQTNFKRNPNGRITKIAILTQETKLLENQFKESLIITEGTLLARELTSEPANRLSPQAYANKLMAFQDFGVRVDVLTEETLRLLNMSALLAAAQGSSEPPRVVSLQWMGADQNTLPIALVGKGVCFDSGGLCLKKAESQPEMKWDKAGAGVVAAVIKTIARLKMPINVVGIIGLIENMPDGAAMKPGDVVESMSGITIEIVNTDAEGRLVLADCLWYAQTHFSPSCVIDLGTLTQETFASLGSAYAGLYSTDSSLSDLLKQAVELAEENLWGMPMGPYFAKQIESSIADIKNLGIEGWGENGAAAEFLKCFIKDIPWAHLDISGVSWVKEDQPLCHHGVTGFGVRLLIEYLQTKSKIVRAAI